MPDETPNPSAELILDDSGQEVDPAGLMFPEEKEAAPAPEPAATDAAPPAAETEAEEAAGEGEAKQEPAPAAEPAKDEETKYEIEGEEVTLADLKQGWTYIQQAIETGKQAEAAREASQGVLNALAENPTDAMLGVFTALAGDDREKGYNALVDFASRIVANHIEQEGMPAEKREALRWKAEADRLRGELEQRQRSSQEAEAKRVEAEETVKLTTEIKGAITAAGLQPTEGLIREVAGQLYEAFSAGLNMTAASAVQLASKKTTKTRQSHLAGLSKADLASIPKEVIAEIRRLDIEALKAQSAVQQPAQKKSTTIKPSGKKQTSRVGW